MSNEFSSRESMSLVQGKRITHYETKVMSNEFSSREAPTSEIVAQWQIDE
jgi:hypothetical protein